MIVGNRLARIIFGTFILLILLLNFLWWVVPKSSIALFGQDPTSIDTLYHFKGFSWFFNHLSKYPGIQPFIKEIMSMEFNIFDNTNIGDGILDILKMLVIPIKVLYGILSTLWQNIAWLFGFIGAMFY